MPMESKNNNIANNDVSVNALDRFNALLMKEKKELEKLSIATGLDIADINNGIYKEHCTNARNVMGKGVWIAYAFGSSGKIIGMLQTLLMNRRYREQLLEVWKLPAGIIDLAYECIGQLPYLSQGKTIVYGHPMNYAKCKELVRYTSSKLGMVAPVNIDQEINEEVWKQAYDTALKRCEDTLKADLPNVANAKVNITYDE